MSVKEVYEKLLAPFYADEIEWKIQTLNNKDKAKATKALIVPYVNARAIMDRLDQVVGFENWQTSYQPGPSGGVICHLALRIGGEWLYKEDGAENTGVEPVKGGISSALKRAAVAWGIGRYLYEVPRRWYDIDERQKPKTEPSLPREFLPADADPKTGNRPGKASATTTTTGTKNGASTTATKAANNNTAAKATAPKAEAPKTEAPVGPTKAPTWAEIDQNVTDPALKIAWAKNLVIPDNIGVPGKGKTLGEMMDSPNLGNAIITYLSGNGANLAGKFFEPAEGDQHQADLLEGAKLLLPEIEARTAAKKKNGK